MANTEGDVVKAPLQQDNKQNGHLTPEPTELMVQELFMHPVHQNSVTEQAKSCLCSITCLALFATLCCNLVLGIPAIVLAVLAHSSSDSGTTRLYSRISLTLSLIGIVSGIIFITTLVIYIVTKYYS